MLAGRLKSLFNEVEILMATARVRELIVAAASFLSIGLCVRASQAQETSVTPLAVMTGRSYPITFPAAISKVSVTEAAIADVVVISDRELVVNAKAPGETDAIIYLTSGVRQHYRIQVRSPSERQQILVAIKFAEIRRDALREIGVSALYRDADIAVGSSGLSGQTSVPRSSPVTPVGGSQFLSILTDFDTDRLLAFISLQESKGRARTLAEPKLMAANREPATFLAGGELPIPIAQGGGAGNTGNSAISVQYREFGVRLRFTGEIINDSLVKLSIEPEVSSLDFGNAIIISGFRIPAFRTRRIQTTVDVRRNESLIISGMFNEDQERVKTGIPGLMDIPILGQLFSSTRYQRSESELLVVVTPSVFDPLRPRRQDVLPVLPDTALPAREAIQKRLPPAARPRRP